jgi:hypothetical protein
MCTVGDEMNMLVPQHPFKSHAAVQEKSHHMVAPVFQYVERLICNQAVFENTIAVAIGSHIGIGCQYRRVGRTCIAHICHKAYAGVSNAKN